MTGQGYIKVSLKQTTNQTHTQTKKQSKKSKQMISINSVPKPFYSYKLPFAACGDKDLLSFKRLLFFLPTTVHILITSIMSFY